MPSTLYDRQKELGLNTDTSITIVGAGGIGYWVAKFAAMSGIKDIYIFDPDTIDESNLNRLDLPDKFLGRNKADLASLVIRNIRPSCNVSARPFKFQSFTYTKTDWIVDCTDKFESQIENQKIARSTGSKYCKAGYDGEEFSINNSVAEWGEADDGYTITPSWVVPASIIAALTVAKILKYHNDEVYSNVKSIMKRGK